MGAAWGSSALQTVPVSSAAQWTLEAVSQKKKTSFAGVSAGCDEESQWAVTLSVSRGTPVLCSLGMWQHTFGFAGPHLSEATVPSLAVPGHLT